MWNKSFDFPKTKKCGVKKRSRKRESKDWSTQEDPSAKTYLNSHGWHSNRLKTLDWQRSPSEKDSGFALMKLSDVIALHEDTLAGKGYNEFTLHDINSLSMKSLWKWTKTVSVHEGIQELMKELLLDSSRFGMEGVIAQLQTNWRHTNLLDRSNPEQSTQRQRIRWSLLVSRWLGNWESTLPWKVHLEFSCRVPRENWTFGAWPGRQAHHCWLQRLLCGRWSLVPCENGCSNLGVEGQEFNREGPFLFTPKSIRDWDTEWIKTRTSDLLQVWISDSDFLAVMKRQYILKQQVKRVRDTSKSISDTETTSSWSPEAATATLTRLRNTGKKLPSCTNPRIWLKTELCLLSLFSIRTVSWTRIHVVKPWECSTPELTSNRHL